MPSSIQSPAPRVIGPVSATPHPRLPAGALRGAVAGAEAALLAWLTMVVPAIATYVATAAAPALGEASWMAASGAGTAVWLLGHGGVLHAGGTVISVTPLGITLLCALLVYGSTRRMRLDSFVAGAFAVAGYTLAVALLGLLAPGPHWSALPGAVVVAVLGALPALRRAGAPWPRWWSVTRRRLPGWSEAGARAAVGALAALGLAALVLTALALVQGMSRIRELQAGLVDEPVSTVVLVLAQLAYVPTVAMWALSWLAGPGFAVGSETAFTPQLVTTAPMPAVPILGALPAPGEAGLGWVVLAPVAVGAAVGLYLHRRHRQPTLPQGALAVVVMTALVGVVTAGLLLAASGSAGPGRMSDVGAAVPAVVGALAVELGAGALAVVVALHPATRRVGAGAWQRVSSRRRRTA